MRLTAIFFVLICMMVAFVGAPQAGHAGWLEFLFPELKQSANDPSKTLKAPFADPDAVIDPTVNKQGLGENATPINMRHRSSAVITKWMESTAADMLVYDAKDYGEQYKKKALAFDTAGLKEYVSFLNSESIVSSLKSGTYNVRSFVKDVPVIINEGEVAGRYRWLYRIKVMVSFVKTDMLSYKDSDTSDEVSKDYILTVHIGRSDKVKNEHGLLIEGWSAVVDDSAHTGKP